MAWTNLLDAVLGHKKPVTLQMLRALRDNPIAIAEGAPNAPPLAPAALERLVPGLDIRARKDDPQSSSSSPLVFFSFGFVQFGTIRLAAEISRTGNAAQLRRWRAGVVTGLATWSPGGSFTPFSADVPVIPGDTLDLYTAGAGCSARNIRLQTDGVDLWPAPSMISIEGNRAAP